MLVQFPSVCLLQLSNANCTKLLDIYMKFVAIIASKILLFKGVFR